MFFWHLFLDIVCFVWCKWCFWSLSSVVHTPYAAFLKVSGQQTDLISLSCHTKNSPCCQTVKLVIGSPREFLHHCYVCVVFVSVYGAEWARACVWHALPCFCVYHKCVCIWGFFWWVWQTFSSDPYYWGRHSLCSTSGDMLNGNMLGREGEKLQHFMRHDDSFIAQGGPRGFPRAPTRKHFKICSCVLPLQVGVSQLVSLIEKSPG